MDALLLFGIIVLNVLISVWNCYAVGTAWKDTMALGGWFNKLILWSAVIQSGVGFSMPILIGLVWGTTSILTMGEEPTLTPAEARQFMELIFNLWYVAVIFPILGSGLAIWAHSLREAYRRRDFASIATAGWNSMAQINNTISAVNNLGGALDSVGDLLSAVFSSKGDNKDDAKGKLAILTIVLVVTSLVAGFLIAFGLVRYFARTSESRIEAYAQEQFART